MLRPQPFYFDPDWPIDNNIQPFIQKNIQAANYDPPSIRIQPPINQVNFSLPYPKSIQFLKADPSQITIKQEKNFPFHPQPPKVIKRPTFEEIQLLKNINSLKKRYEYIWVLICEKDHNARSAFVKIYEEDLQKNTSHRLQNMMTPAQYDRLQLLIKEGLDIKVMCDYSTYEKKVKGMRTSLENENQVMEVLIEKGGRQRLQPSKKVKFQQNLTEAIEIKVKEDMEKCKKDVAFYNFVHLNSSPQLFNRRSIIQGCLISKTKQQFFKGIQEFHRLIEQDLEESYQSNIKKIDKSQIQDEKRRKRKTKQIHDQFLEYLPKMIESNHPINEQDKEIKDEFYKWVIVKYMQESSIYKVLNNRVRFTVNQIKMQGVSVVVYLLFSALRYFFVNRYKQINFQTVYRGARVSLLEQKKFKKGLYLWNLAFLSTSQDEKKAVDFLNFHSKDEAVLFIINIPPDAKEFVNLEDHEGFFHIHTLFDQKTILNNNNLKAGILQQKQVIFNPLNSFVIEQWHPRYPKKLVLTYAPHLQILQKKSEKQPITEQEEQFLNNIFKLRDKDYDKGVKCLEEGDPIKAIEFYESSEINGEELSYAQKSSYYESLKSIGDIQKIDEILKSEIEKEESNIESNVPKELESVEKIVESVASIQFFEQSTEFETINDKAETIVNSIKKFTDLPNYSNILLEIKGLIELANIKFKVNETLKTIETILNAFLLIDQLAEINFQTRLKEMIEKLKKLNFNNLSSFPDLNKIIKKDYKGLSQGYDQFDSLRQSQRNNYAIETYFPGEGANITNEDISSQKRHEAAQKIIPEYFQKRQQKRTELQEMESDLCKAQSNLTDIELKKSFFRSEEQDLKDKQIHRQLRNQLHKIKKQYLQLFVIEEKGYDIMYQTLYKTNYDISGCLAGFLLFYQRYEEYIRYIFNQKESLEVYEVVRKYGERLIQYDRINRKIKDLESSKGGKKLKQAYDILQIIQGRQKKTQHVIYKKQKTELLNSRAEYYRKQYSELKTTGSTTNLEKSNNDRLFVELRSILKEIQSQYQNDNYINPVVSQVKVVSQKIQITNESSGFKIENQSYPQRLRQCHSFYKEIQNTIKQYKYEQLMEKNLNMCRLYLLMADNQYKLGLVNNSMKFLEKCDTNLNTILKIDKQNSRLDKKKLLYGNPIKIGIFKLKAQFVTFGQSKSAKRKLLQELIEVKNFISRNMHEPLNLAEIHEAIGVICSQLYIIYKSPRQYLEFQNNIKACIKIRKVHYGQNNKKNARNYTLLMEVAYLAKNQSTKIFKQYYDQGLKIYLKLPSKDPTIILYRMIHEYRRFLYQKDISMARHYFFDGLRSIYYHENRCVSMELVKEIFNACQTLFNKKKYHEIKQNLLDVCLQFLNELQSYISKMKEDQEERQVLQKIRKEKEIIYDTSIQLLTIQKNPQKQGKLETMKQKVITLRLSA